MKIFGLILMMLPFWVKAQVLVSYFDPFGGAPHNNSERIALELNLRLERLGIKVNLCPLSTVFKFAYGQAENCLKQLEQSPQLFLGLGEGNCQLKLETMARNRDRSYGPDNAGEERQGTIIDGAADELGLRYPVPVAYCALEKTDRRSIEISNHAGSFVCNNMAFQLTYYYPELMFTFIHVPAHNCQNLETLNHQSIEHLEKMVVASLNFIGTNPPHGEMKYLPHSSNKIRLPVGRKELRNVRSENKNICYEEFFERLNSVMGIFNFRPIQSN